MTHTIVSASDSHVYNVGLNITFLSLQNHRRPESGYSLLKEPQTPPPKERFTHIQKAEPVTTARQYSQQYSSTRPEAKSLVAPSASTRPASCGALSSATHRLPPVGSSSQPVLHSPVIGSVLPPTRRMSGGGPQSPRRTTPTPPTSPKSPVSVQGVTSPRRTQSNQNFTFNTNPYTRTSLPPVVPKIYDGPGELQSGDYTRKDIKRAQSEVISPKPIEPTNASTVQSKIPPQATTVNMSPTRHQPSPLITQSAVSTTHKTADTTPSISKLSTTTNKSPLSRIADTKSSSTTKPLMSSQEAEVIKQAQQKSQARRSHEPLSQMEELKIIARASEEVSHKSPKQTLAKDNILSTKTAEPKQTLPKDNILSTKTAEPKQTLPKDNILSIKAPVSKQNLPKDDTLPTKTILQTLPDDKGKQDILVKTAVSKQPQEKRPVTTKAAPPSSTSKAILPTTEKKTESTSKQNVALPVIGKKSLASSRGQRLQAAVSLVPNKQLVSPSLVRVNQPKATILIGKPPPVSDAPLPVDEDIIVPNQAVSVHSKAKSANESGSAKVPAHDVIVQPERSSPVSVPPPVPLTSPPDTLSSSLDSLLEANMLPNTPSGDKSFQHMKTPTGTPGLTPSITKVNTHPLDGERLQKVKEVRM